jgi:F-type H+-transporting ATPase subunit epsilon
MSQGELKIKILSPERILYRGVVKSLGMPGKLGYMSVLPGHAAMVAQLDAGVLAFEADGQTDRLFITGGFVDVSNNEATVLAEVVEKPAEINVERAKKALARADERLSSSKDVTINVPRALDAKKRATVRLELAGAVKALH